MPTSAPNTSFSWCERHYRWLLGAILIASLALRVWLASTGGQGYWPDEMRYSSASREAAWQFAHGAWRDAWLPLIGTADHLLFKIAGIPIALWEQSYGPNPVLVASWFGLFSVLAIGLIAALAREAGASGREGLLAALFAAGASSLFYYSRHFFPYDLSLFFCLLAGWLALGQATWWRSAGAGLAAGLGFLAYNGYWLLGGVVLVFHVLKGGGWKRILGRALVAGAGLLAPIVTAVVAARGLDRDLITSFREFSSTITQGDFGRGWILVGQYLWDTEGWMLVMWVVLATVAAWFAGGQPRRRLAVWLGAAAVLYAGLVLFSDVLRAFVIYGRTARILAPFLCLAAAAGAEVLANKWPRWWVSPALLLMIFAVAAPRQAAALRQVFPDDFLRVAAVRAQVARAESPWLLRVLNADRLGEGRVQSETRPHTILVRQAHPLEFAPYLYEGFDEQRRRLLRAQDISMQLVAVPAVSLPEMDHGYPGPIRLRLKFPPERMAAGISEPLLTSGVAGQANFLYVQYVDAGHVRFGYDCWGRGSLLGSPISIDMAKQHTVLLSSAAQLPPDASRPADLGPLTWARLHRDVVVAIDGEVALAASAATNPAEARTLFVGANFAGGSSTRQEFSGEIQGIERAEWREVLKLLPADRLEVAEATERLTLAVTGPDWQGYCGPLRLRVRLPAGPAGQAEPLIVSGKMGAGDFVYLRHLGDGRVTFGFDHWGVGGPESPPVTLDGAREFDIVISYGGLLPPTNTERDRRLPGLAALRGSVVVAVDNRVVLTATLKSHPAKPGEIWVGTNAIGGSSTALQFGGELVSVVSEPIDAVLRLQSAAAAR